MCTDPMLKRTRVAVKVMEGKDLLVSDLPTGTSDPVAFVWVGSNEEGEVDLQKDERVQVKKSRGSLRYQARYPLSRLTVHANRRETM